MTHDPYQMHTNPFQMNPAIGAYPGLTNAFSSPYAALQTSAINPAFGYNPLAANSGLYGGVGQQLGIPSQGFGLSPFTNAWQNPFTNAVYQNPFTAQQNPFVNPLINPLMVAAIQRELIQNQLAAAAQQNLLNPILAAQLAGQVYQQQPYQQQPYQQQQYQQPYQQHMGQGGWGQQQGTPFSQFNNPFAQATLAPQSWVGQGQQGQIHPLLLQSLARGLQSGQGISPWSTF